MNEWLKTRTFGMPRWAFLVLLAGGIILGLYLRARNKAAEAAAMGETTYEGTDVLTGATGDTAAGLAGVGVVSPPGGVYPVSSPVIPEGFTDVVSSLTQTVSEQAAGLQTIAQAYTPQTPVVNVAIPTGGGPPNSPPKTVPKGTHAEYLRRLREIRDRHGANSQEVKNFRARHPDQLA